MTLTREKVQDIFKKTIKDFENTQVKNKYKYTLNFIDKNEFISLKVKTEVTQAFLRTGVFKDFFKDCPYF